MIKKIPGYRAVIPLFSPPLSFPVAASLTSEYPACSSRISLFPSFLRQKSPGSTLVLSACFSKNLSQLPKNLPLSHPLTAEPLPPTTLQLPSSMVFNFFCWKKSPRVKLPLTIKTTNLIPYQPVLEWHVVIPDDDTFHNRAVEMSPQNGGLH